MTPDPSTAAPFPPVPPAPGSPPRPSAPALQVNALQALCRKTFGFRLAMIALAAPFALANTARGPATWLVSAAVLVTFMLSYVLLRDWERFGPVLLRHPSLLAADALFGALLLVTASPESTLGYVTLCTPLLAGLVYGWRGAAAFAVLESLLVAGAYAVNHTVDAGGNALLLPGLCVIAGAVGSTLRKLILDLGTATHALGEARARIAAHEAVEGERARLAREMHDSVAKTLHGVALAAEGLAAGVDRGDPPALRRQAELVARAARRAAAESRELLSDLRRGPDREAGTDLAAELRRRAAEPGGGPGPRVAYRDLGTGPLPRIPAPLARQLLAIADEAVENARRHSGADGVEVAAGVVGGLLRVSVHDDGCGLPPGTTLDGLAHSGHFGLLGMVERAAALGARIRIGRDTRAAGTEVRVDLPLHLLRPARPDPAAAEAAGVRSLPADPALPADLADPAPLGAAAHPGAGPAAPPGAEAVGAGSPGGRRRPPRTRSRTRP
ncbi:sensor histidine kinase [Streptomyces sp. C10-9-1]|uniref:sensor histidine kinase n=1 Tax=Streptomyces sp. C10-9-1 TaxID=1859285 RepID=UPI003F4A7601